MARGKGQSNSSKMRGGMGTHVLVLLSGIYLYILVIWEGSVSQVEALSKAPASSAVCPDPGKLKPGMNATVSKAWAKPCVAHYEYCIPPTEKAEAACPGKLVFSPQRQRCDIRKTCKDIGKESDMECLSLPCGLYAHYDCKKYYVCAGGAKIWKECPGETVFDYLLEECKINGVCKYPAEPIIPTELNPNDPDPLDESLRAGCDVHDNEASEAYEDTENADPPGTILDSRKVTDWGKWQTWQLCPKDHYIVGLSTWKRSIEDKNGNFDHGGISSVGFKCANLNQKSKKDAIIGDYAKGTTDRKWDPFWTLCERGAAVGFNLAQMEEQGDEDDVATDNVALFCSCGVEQEIFKDFDDDKYEKVGRKLMDFEDEGRRFCAPKQALCGFRAQFQDFRKDQKIDLKNADMTGLNQMKFKCCGVTSPVETCTPKARKRYLQVCDNREGYVKRPCPVSTYVGTMINGANHSKAAAFYTSIGYEMDQIMPDLETSMMSKIPACKPTGICMYDWAKQEGVLLKRLFSSDVEIENTEVNCTSGTEYKLYQVIVECGMFDVWTNQIIMEPNEMREGAAKPEPESHIWEWTVSHKARKRRSVRSSVRTTLRRSKRTANKEEGKGLDAVDGKSDSLTASLMEKDKKQK